MKTRPLGVIPPMTTPFSRDGEIDFKLIAPQVDWLISAGSHGMAAGGSTGEGHTLDRDEFAKVMLKRAADGLVVRYGEGAAKLADTVLVSVDRPWRDQKMIYGVFDSRRLVGEIATHSVERNKNLSGVETVVTGILFFGFHYADDGIGDAIHPNGLAEGLAFGKQLFLGIAAEKRHVAGVFVVFVVVEAALSGGHAANLTERSAMSPR